MILQDLLPPLVLGRTRDLVLRGMPSRSEREVRATLARGAHLVARLLKHHAVRHTGGLPADWEQRVVRKQIQGNGNELPDLVAYTYEGVEVLAVWTYLENNALHILVRRSRHTAVVRPMQRVRPMLWDYMPWGSQMSGA